MRIKRIIFLIIWKKKTNLEFHCSSYYHRWINHSNSLKFEKEITAIIDQYADRLLGSVQDKAR